jgi:hypothetical protein
MWLVVSNDLKDVFPVEIILGTIWLRFPSIFLSLVENARSNNTVVLFSLTCCAAHLKPFKYNFNFLTL